MLGFMLGLQSGVGESEDVDGGLEVRERLGLM